MVLRMRSGSFEARHRCSRQTYCLLRLSGRPALLLLSIATFCLFDAHVLAQGTAALKPDAPEYKAPPAQAQEDQGVSGREDSAADRRPFLGNIYPEDLPPLFSSKTRVGRFLSEQRIRSYGWIDGGVTTISNASGLVTEAPTSNRFSNQAMLDGAWAIVDRQTTKQLSWGFRSDFYVGADAALLRPLDSFGPTGPRWGTDFRQAYVTFHVPRLLQRGFEINAGRINNPNGYETLMAPYRHMYSESYYWLHYQVGSTALQAVLHPGSRLDLVLGMVMGYNTVFTLRGRAPDYIARTIYRPRGDKALQLLATVYTGPEPAAANKGHIGTWQTLAELQARELWTPRLSQVVLVHYMADTSDPANNRHTSATQGAFITTAYKFSDKLYLNSREEWFADTHGVRVAVPGSYGEAALGLSLDPVPALTVRPEIRGDFSGQPSFGSADNSTRHRNQLSIAFEIVYKGRFF